MDRGDDRKEESDGQVVLCSESLLDENDLGEKRNQTDNSSLVAVRESALDEISLI